ncbi:MAG: anti-sigma F factor [Candidatus Fimadaptatus sp.]|jgi:stage II sporulation protein AB (anti-sigma F factor)
MNCVNEMRVDFLACGENEGFARLCAAAFIMRMDPTVEQMNDVKTAVSEAVTNAIIHGYEGRHGMVRLSGSIFDDGTAAFEVHDAGRGIDDVEQARQPFYTSRPDMERSGLGFTVMETLMDTVEVTSQRGRGTIVRMTKHLGAHDGDA